jgi:hypothetical protein
MNTGLLAGDFKNLFVASKEIVQNGWNSLSSAQQLGICAAAFTGISAYLLWPIKKQVAYEKAEKKAAEYRTKIDKKISMNTISPVTFRYGYFWEKTCFKVFQKLNPPCISIYKYDRNYKKNSSNIPYLRYQKNESNNRWDTIQYNFFKDDKEIKQITKN